MIYGWKNISQNSLINSEKLLNLTSGVAHLESGNYP